MARCFTVYHEFGYGFVEPVYRNAVAVELGRRGIETKREVPVEICYCVWQSGHTESTCSCATK
ncbi:MAG: GxxExxY protein [Gemmatimonadaceae bacterium]